MEPARRRQPRRPAGRQGLQPRPLHHHQGSRTPAPRRGRDGVPAVPLLPLGVGEGTWLPAGAWQACVGQPEFTDGEPVWLGVDIGGEWSASALVWINEQLHVGCGIYHGDSAVLEIADHIRSLAAAYQVREVAFDMWRAGQLAAELDREGLTVSAFPQTDVRMIPASARLHAAIVEQRLVLPDDPELAKHAADAIAKHSRRGWRLDKPTKRTHIDALIALTMALDRVENQPAPVEVIGWI
jgi:hypothetical protein